MTVYEQSLTLLNELHAMLARGEDESQEAEAIRDDLERLWGALTPIEREKTRVYSARLNEGAQHGQADDRTA